MDVVMEIGSNLKFALFWGAVIVAVTVVAVTAIRSL